MQQLSLFIIKGPLILDNRFPPNSLFRKTRMRSLSLTLKDFVNRVCDS